jgi:NAD(P)-dependent dehydrogenase (short-subunit alcohol dehydrogenase family)
MNILITGASRGIGAATLALFESSGHNALGHSTRGDGQLIAGDLAQAFAPRQIWDAAIDRLGGRIDVLVNNAGVYEDIADDASDDDWHAAWQRTMTVNLQAAADLSRHAVNHFRDAGGGRIINVASRAGHRGDSPRHWHYAASKAALLGVTKTIARGYARDNILAFAVSPGFTMTGMVEDYMASRNLGDSVLAEIPLGRVANADEVAEAIRWLAIDAPAAATGSVIDVNGASYVR